MPDDQAAAPEEVRERGGTAEAARFWDAQVSHPDRESRHWLDCEAVARVVNARITGDPGVYPVQALGDLLRGEPPVERALSVGCGTGSLERVLVRENVVEQVDGVDVSAAALARAAELARREGMDGRIAYREADAAAWLPVVPPGRYQLILFHGSLHHLAGLETVLASAAAILRGSRPGLLYVDEYVGPSRELWCEADLAAARRLFARVAPGHRRTPELMQPMDALDPSEMVRSAEIEPLLRAHFAVERYRPYYGNVLFPLLSAIRGSAYSDPAIEALIGEAVALEEEMIQAGGVRPLFAWYLARPRPATEAARRAALWRDRRTGVSGVAGYESELALRELVAERTAENRGLYREIARLNALIQRMESAKLWRLHAFWERHVRAPLRRRRTGGTPPSS
jgi:SAM-dependent methyltransferase